jgi:hypothetical protein
MLSCVPVDGEGLGDPKAYKMALVLTWIGMWIARVFLVLWLPHLFLSKMESPVLHRLADVLFWIIWPVCALLTAASLVLLQRSGIRLVSMFHFDEVEDHATIRAFFQKAVRWRRPWLVG